MKDKLKTVIMIIIVLIVASIMVWCVYKVTSSNNSFEMVSNVINNQNEIEEATNLVNNTVENEIENEVENEVQNVTVDEQNATNNTSQSTSTEVITNNGATNEEKAINIVKKNWGSEEGVYFVTMGIDSKGRYIVTVNDSSTTATYAWYAVNVETGEFEVQ